MVHSWFCQTSFSHQTLTQTHNNLSQIWENFYVIINLLFFLDTTWTQPRGLQTTCPSSSGTPPWSGYAGTATQRRSRRCTTAHMPSSAAPCGTSSSSWATRRTRYPPPASSPAPTCRQNQRLHGLEADLRPPGSNHPPPRRRPPRHRAGGQAGPKRSDSNAAPSRPRRRPTSRRLSTSRQHRRLGPFFLLRRAGFLHAQAPHKPTPPSTTTTCGPPGRWPTTSWPLFATKKLEGAL
jgi:hypothetical protein